MNQKLNVRWFYLAVGAIAMLFAGIIYAWSILKGPLAAEFGWGASQLALNFTITMTCWCFGGLAGSIITKKTNIKVSSIISAVLIFAGFALASRVTSLGLLYISYGVLAGFGIGMSYNIVVSGVSQWFPDKKGTCSGVLMMAFGISALVLGSAANSMFASEAFGWRKTYFILGIVIAVIIAIAGLIIKLPAPGTEFPKVEKKAGSKENFEVKDLTTPEMVKRVSFWMFFIYSILIASVGNSVISFAKDLAISAGAAASLATSLVGVLSICNGLGRIICGFVFDALGRRKTMLISNAITIVAPAVTLISVLTHSVPLCVIGLCFVGLSYGFAPTITSAFTSAFYGMKSFPSNYSLANMMIVPTSFIATLSNSLAASTGAYVVPFIMLLAFSLVALVINLSLKRP